MIGQRAKPVVLRGTQNQHVRALMAWFNEHQGVHAAIAPHNAALDPVGSERIEVRGPPRGQGQPGWLLGLIVCTDNQVHVSFFEAHYRQLFSTAISRLRERFG